MLLTAFLLLASAGLIYLSCELFVNAIEWFGAKLNLGATATGTVLAAFGTALPESAVTFTAVVFGSPAEKDLGVGAALGGPLVLATIAYGIVGLALWRQRRLSRSQLTVVRVDNSRLARDQACFLGIFAVKVALGFVTFAYKPALGFLFVAAYAVYVWREVISSETAPEEEGLEPLKFHAGTMDPAAGWIAVQLLVAVGMIAIASHIFVNQLGAVGAMLGLPAHIVALLLSPVATELPETMNAIIWVRCGKERLALANISGAMMIQATIPSALGLFFTPWLFDASLAVAAGVTAIAILFLWRLFRRGPVDAKTLSWVAVFYVLFAAFVVWRVCPTAPASTSRALVHE